jgi:UDP-hydrolysing UDP-N-acetyl-D-glucosamine 2-epimerase
MIGDGWNDDPSVRPSGLEPAPARPRRVAVVTGTRAEFGLLKPVMHAVQAHTGLELLCIAAGSHLIQPAETFREVKAVFPIADSIPMQVAGRTGRAEDAESLGRGIGRFARSFDRLRPDWVVVLGDRIEAFAAAASASVSGIAVAHIHGGDRAEGIADEAMRHAITKLAHLHLAATEQSADRIRRMGERPERVFNVGSPAIDGLASVPPLGDDAWGALGRPSAVLLMHPIGRTDEQEEHAAALVLSSLRAHAGAVLALHPNHDPGREGILRALRGVEGSHGVHIAAHLPRERFIALLKRLAASPSGLLAGNSSAGLIEAAALRLPALDIGRRQSGRERPGNVVHVERESPDRLAAGLREAGEIDRGAVQHPYGDGRAGERIAGLLAAVDPLDGGLLRKRCVY